MKGKRRLSRASFVALGLGALGGCDGGEAPPFQPNEIFAQVKGPDGDSRGTSEWKDFLTAKALHRAWAPDAQSRWRGYYKPTLPAAMNIVAEAARPVHEASSVAEQQALDFARTLKPGSAVFVDLPGEESVAWGAKLAGTGLEPVLTFNNWPHPQGVVPLERPLGALLYYAKELAALRREKPPAFQADPVFLLDSRRIGTGTKATPPGKFDNRYFHVAADFPEPAIFKRLSITSVVYVGLKRGMPYECHDDLAGYFAALASEGLSCTFVAADARELEITAWAPKARTTVFTPPLANQYASTHRSYGRSYHRYHSFWSGNRSTWGSGSSGGGSRSFS